MQLRPLKQWICDTCGEVIRQPKHGYLEWVATVDNGVYHAHELRIVHHAPRSPYYNKKTLRGGCYGHDGKYGRSDLPLDCFVGSVGLSRFLSIFLDVGPDLKPDYPGPQVVDMRAAVEVMRRLYVPYYEEARLYWAVARGDGFFREDNEVTRYRPSTLRELIAQYGPAAEGH